MRKLKTKNHCIQLRQKWFLQIEKSRRCFIRWLNNGLKQGFAFTITLDGEHNHALVENIGMIASRYRKLDPDDIKLLATCGVRAGAIIEVLQKKHPDKYVHARIVYNVDQVIQHKNSGTGDAGSMYFELTKQQQEDSTFYVDAYFEGKDNHLARLS
ncbi:822_t:CDS:2 [Rhizophagus irregularis]|nr:822_t:CDS:2 [Rhizophagus irregularis]